MADPDGPTGAAGLTIGWREWIALPELGLPAVKVKVDTGARTSAIHAFDIERERDPDGTEFAAFSVHPLQRDRDVACRCRAPLVGVRRVTDSGGHGEERMFVATEIVLGPVRRTVEITLTERHDMLFRMLLGRTALVPDLRVDPARSFLCGRVSARRLYHRTDDRPGDDDRGTATP